MHKILYVGTLIPSDIATNLSNQLNEHEYINSPIHLSAIVYSNCNTDDGLAYIQHQHEKISFYV